MLKDRLKSFGLDENIIEKISEEVKNEIQENYVSYDEVQKELENQKNSILQEHNKEIMKIKAENLIENSLRNAGARNIKAVRALLNIDENSFDGNQISGLDEQIKNLTQNEDSSFLFKNDSFQNEYSPNNFSQNGINGSFSGFRPISSEEKTEKSFDEMSYSEMCQYLENK